ncbi:biliverdin-producing heme oxygenase [Litoreibacter ponti]|uniref:biliverdin-producing heme oxygenase n=1 Tax=Litoreibacter ponti TaxID=1510457 RepID=UPI000D315624|nr:biliverdin-producing heme oxygenase [Litoreibacter ponti]
MTHTNFRQVLKAETWADHERVDGLISTLDLSTFEDFVRFLTIHQGCFDSIRGLMPKGSAAWRALDDMVRGIETDLNTLGASAPVPALPNLRTPDALAVDYVIEGSRLGSKVLRRRWMAASDPRVRKADAYFSLPPVPGRWRDVCDQLSAISVPSERAGRIVHDTRMLFSLFYTAASETAAHQHRSVELAS